MGRKHMKMAVLFSMVVLWIARTEAQNLEPVLEASIRSTAEFGINFEERAQGISNVIESDIAIVLFKGELEEGEGLPVGQIKITGLHIELNSTSDFLVEIGEVNSLIMFSPWYFVLTGTKNEINYAVPGQFLIPNIFNHPAEADRLIINPVEEFVGVSAGFISGGAEFELGVSSRYDWRSAPQENWVHLEPSGYELSEDETAIALDDGTVPDTADADGDGLLELLEPAEVTTPLDSDRSNTYGLYNISIRADLKPFQQLGLSASVNYEGESNILGAGLRNDIALSLKNSQILFNTGIDIAVNKFSQISSEFSSVVGLRNQGKQASLIGLPGAVLDEQDSYAVK
jgi:hypothetical protein